MSIYYWTIDASTTCSPGFATNLQSVNIYIYICDTIKQSPIQQDMCVPYLCPQFCFLKKNIKMCLDDKTGILLNKIRKREMNKERKTLLQFSQLEKKHC
jgi:hypothetical protein